MDHLLTKMKRSVLLDDERRERDDIEDRMVSSPREERAAAMKLAAEVCRLVEDVEMLKAGAEDTSVKFGGLGVKSLHDCQAWILDNFKPERYGLLMDPLFMLERVFGSDSPEGNLIKILEIHSAPLSWQLCRCGTVEALLEIERSILRPQPPLQCLAST